VLHREERHALPSQTFYGAVVEIHVREFGAAFQGIAVHSESMILRGDFHLLRPEIHHGVVRAVMPEIQFVGRATQSESQDLMTKTNSENRLLSEHRCDRAVGVWECGRICRSIREKNAVGIVSENLLSGRISR